jgi:5-methylcytosine-specific restriction endonuclease McrA
MDDKLKGLQLVAAMADHVSVEYDELAQEVVAESKDKRRAFRGRLRASIWQRDKGRCFYCDKQIMDGERWHADHVIPHTLGGQTVENNGVVSCPPCNLSKGKRLW